MSTSRFSEKPSSIKQERIKSDVDCFTTPSIVTTPANDDDEHSLSKLSNNSKVDTVGDLHSSTISEGLDSDSKVAEKGNTEMGFKKRELTLKDNHKGNEKQLAKSKTDGDLLNGASRTIVLKALRKSTRKACILKSNDGGEDKVASAHQVDEEWLRHLTMKLAGYGIDITYEIFKTALGVKEDYVAKRVFNKFDEDGDNIVDLTTLIRGLQQLLNGDVKQKVTFIFSLFDINNDGYLTREEMENAIAQSIVDTKSDLKSHTAKTLTEIIYSQLDPTNTGSISIDKIAEMCKQEGLEEALFLSIATGLKAKQHKLVENTESRSSSCLKVLQNNRVLVGFWIVYISILIVLFVTKCWQVRENNWWIILAKGNGQVLNFTCSVTFLLMARRTLTFLRNTPIGKFLPIDKSIAIHKATGHIIMAAALWHTLMHLFNIGLNLTTQLDLTYAEILFTLKSRIGWIEGFAPLSGFLLWIVFLVIYIPAMPFFRKLGFFEAFFWTHQGFYIMLILLILHGPVFWQFALFPVLLYLIERVLRTRCVALMRWGQTYIREGIALPSNVTHLIIERPPGFTYKSGDYVFVNIPSIAHFEWHPFTISSCPELPDSIWLHVRGVGGWTNKVYEHYAAAAEIKHKQIESRSIKFKKQLGLIDQEARSTRKSGKLSCVAEVDEESSDTLSRSSQGHLSTGKDSSVSATDDVITVEADVHQHGQRELRRCGTALSLEDRLVNRERALSFISRNSQRNASTKASFRFSSRSHLGIPSKKKNDSNTDSTDATPGDVTLDMDDQQKELEIDDIIATNHSLSVSASNKRRSIGEKKLQIFIHGPYGTPSEAIYTAEHAVLVAGGIGVTPFASILQSITYKMLNSKVQCPDCEKEFVPNLTLTTLKKVDFFWVNRDRHAFEWFFELLSQLEIEQNDMLRSSSTKERMVDYHLFMTRGPQMGDTKAIALNLAEMVARKEEQKDIFTGLNSITNIGRPNWEEIFAELSKNRKGKITVFFCGPNQMGSQVRDMCRLYGYQFRKEVF